MEGEFSLVILAVEALIGLILLSFGGEDIALLSLDSTQPVTPLPFLSTYASWIHKERDSSEKKFSSISEYRSCRYTDGDEQFRMVGGFYTLITRSKLGLSPPWTYTNG